MPTASRTWAVAAVFAVLAILTLGVVTYTRAGSSLLAWAPVLILIAAFYIAVFRTRQPGDRLSAVRSSAACSGMVIVFCINSAFYSVRTHHSPTWSLVAAFFSALSVVVSFWETQRIRA